MRIEHDYKKDEHRYYDANGVELHENDIVFFCGKNMRVFLTDANTLGTDATNPAWIRDGRAEEADFGIYPFETSDDPVLVCKADEYIHSSFNCLTGEFVKKEV